MKIYLLSQSENSGYDTFDSCVVCAENEEDAKTIHPNGISFIPNDEYGAWAFSTDQVSVSEIGIANEDQKRGVICSSFNAG